MHLLNEEYLMECYKELKRGKAAGIDNRTLESYTEKEMGHEIKELVQEMKERKYKPKPAKRVYIPKSNGKQRPLGMPAVRDKVVQQGLKKILEAVYEPHFLENSYGCKRAKTGGKENQTHSIF